VLQDSGCHWEWIFSFSSAEKPSKKFAMEQAINLKWKIQTECCLLPWQIMWFTIRFRWLKLSFRIKRSVRVPFFTAENSSQTHWIKQFICFIHRCAGVIEQWKLFGDSPLRRCSRRQAQRRFFIYKPAPLVFTILFYANATGVAQNEKCKKNSGTALTGFCASPFI